MKICRLCLLQEADKLISISQNEEMLSKIKDCVSLEIRECEALSAMVCLSCIKKVQEWYAFKNVCLKSNEILLKKTQYSQQTEEIDLEDIKYFLVVQDEREGENHKSIKEYVCDICSKKFANCFEYLDHQSLHNGNPVFKCADCPEVFSNRQSLLKHDRTHKKPCHKCGKLILLTSMKQHLIKHTDRYQCPQCLNRFNSRAVLEQHKITVHSGRKDHICETCGKTFSSRTAMIVHKKSHTNERPYNCKICSYAGKTASALYVHMATHAKDTRICEVCSKIFKSDRNLYDHLRRVHSKKKNHVCPYCEKSFVDKYMLSVHLRYHTGVRPFQCSLCDKSFMRSDGLKEHMIIHDRERMCFECDKCGKKFTSKKGAKRHRCGNEIEVI